MAVVDASGCFITEPILVDLATLTAPIETEKNINISPNPTTGMIIITNSFNEKFNINITNVIGKLIYTTQTSEKSMKINLSSQPDGIYFASFQSTYQTQTIKIILSK